MGFTSIFLLCVSFVGLVRSVRTLPHVERYDVVRPRALNVRIRRSLFSPQGYPDEIQYALNIDGGNHTIHLERNRNLIAKDYTETHYLEDGSRVTRSPNYEDHCYYHGHIQGIEDSSVSVAICSGISGFVRARQRVYLIEPLEATVDGDHALYRQEHLRTNRSRCGLSDTTASNSTLSYDHDHGHNHYDHDLAPKASGLFKTTAWKGQSNTGPQKYVEMYLVVDNAEYKRYGDQTKARMLEIANHVDKLYRPMNTRIMLVGLEIWTNRNLIDVSKNSEKTLDRFLLWRQNDLLKRNKHDNAQFVTGIDFDGDTVGLANKFAMCTGNSGAINQDHNNNHIALASTIAHEMGHNLGMSHDSQSCTCVTSLKGNNCIMADKIRSVYPESFSTCSQEQLWAFLDRAQPRCVLDRPSSERLYVGASCGNSFLDPGEECDCGTVEECKNRCCDASTCRLSPGSRCAHGGCCESCQLKQGGVECRASASDCDLPEACTGISEHCPEDAFEMNGTPCDYGQGYCYNGQCPRHLTHCRRLFGPAAKVAEDYCFDLNTQGTEGSHCGQSRDGRYARCSKTDVKCGSIFCASEEDSITGRRAVFTMSSGSCFVAVDDDKTRKFDMVPTGTKCGPSKVCYDNRCQDVSVFGIKEQCSKKCNNKGVCDHKEECHCNPGWAPPYCEVRYSDLPQGQPGVIAGVCGAVAAVLLLSLVVGGLMCYKKNKKDNYASKSPRTLSVFSSCLSRKVCSSPGQLNPTFQEGSDKPTTLDKALIGAPTFLESSATQASTPLFARASPARPAPLPPNFLQADRSSTPTERYGASKSRHPPVPPVKPSALPVPPVKPSATPVPPVKPSAPPVPPVKPKALTPQRKGP